MYQGDGMHNAAALLPDLINDGIRLLVYAGNAGELSSCRPPCESRSPSIFCFFYRRDVQLHGTYLRWQLIHVPRSLDLIPFILFLG